MGVSQQSVIIKNVSNITHKPKCMKSKKSLSASMKCDSQTYLAIPRSPTLITLLFVKKMF